MVGYGRAFVIHISKTHSNTTLKLINKNIAFKNNYFFHQYYLEKKLGADNCCLFVEGKVLLELLIDCFITMNNNIK